MRSTPKIDAALRVRLKEAVDRFSNGSADEFGRFIGYTNGGYIREVLGKKGKPVREALIERVHAKAPGWFDAVLFEMRDADQTLPREAWSFIKRFLALPPEERRVVNRMLGVDEPEPPAAGPFQPVVKDAWSPPEEFLGGNSAFDRNAEEQAEEQFRKRPAKPVKGRGR